MRHSDQTDKRRLKERKTKSQKVTDGETRKVIVIGKRQMVNLYHIDADRATFPTVIY